MQEIKKAPDEQGCLIPVLKNIASVKVVCEDSKKIIAEIKTRQYF